MKSERFFILVSILFSGCLGRNQKLVFPENYSGLYSIVYDCDCNMKEDDIGDYEFDFSTDRIMFTSKKRPELGINYSIYIKNKEGGIIYQSSNFDTIKELGVNLRSSLMNIYYPQQTRCLNKKPNEKHTILIFSLDSIRKDVKVYEAFEEEIRLELFKH